MGAIERVWHCTSCDYETDDDLFECPKCGGVMEFSYEER
jgi:predicted RNA-binding Zn-ribbon protein involved in translation (DUF1610 family)